MAVFPWPRTPDFWQTHQISKWLKMQKHFKLDPTYCAVVESGRDHEILNIVQELKKVNGKLCILVTPDDKIDASRKALPPWVQAKDDSFWVAEYTKYAPYFQGIEIAFVHYDMEGYNLNEYTEAQILGRMWTWRGTVERYLLGGQNIPSFWYGHNWNVPKISTAGRYTGSYVWPRLPNIDGWNPNFVNMYPQFIEPTLECLKKTSIDIRPGLFTHWVGVVKDNRIGKDVVPTDIDCKQAYWGERLRENAFTLLYMSNRNLNLPANLADDIHMTELCEFFSSMSGIKYTSGFIKEVLSIKALNAPPKMRTK